MKQSALFEITDTGNNDQTIENICRTVNATLGLSLDSSAFHYARFAKHAFVKVVVICGIPQVYAAVFSRYDNAYLTVQMVGVCGTILEDYNRPDYRTLIQEAKSKLQAETPAELRVALEQVETQFVENWLLSKAHDLNNL